MMYVGKLAPGLAGGSDSAALVLIAGMQALREPTVNIVIHDDNRIPPLTLSLWTGEEVVERKPPSLRVLEGGKNECGSSVHGDPAPVSPDVA